MNRLHVPPIRFRAAIRRGLFLARVIAPAIFLLAALLLVMPGGRAAAHTTAGLTVVKETDPAGGTDFPFTLGWTPPQFVTKWGSEGDDIGEFDSPIDLAVDGAGNVYVVDSNNNRIQKFNSDGGYLAQWGTLGSGVDEFDDPDGVAVDGVGNVYVTDTNNHRVLKFNSNGVYLAQWGTEGSDNGQFNTPDAVAVDGESNVYVVDQGNNRIQKFTSDGVFLTKWGEQGGNVGQFDDPDGVAVDGEGNVYVTDSGNHRVQKFNSDGVYLTHWGESGSEEGRFIGPNGVTVDGDGNVYVADQGNDRIQKFDSNGTFITSWGIEGSDNGQFTSPIDVAVDGDGNVYVTDVGNDRVQKFSQQSSFLLDDDQSQEFPALAPGDYTLSEIVPEGWELDEIDCDGGSPVVDRSSVGLTLAAGDDITCTFRNVTPASLTVVKETFPAGGTGFPFTLGDTPPQFVAEWGSEGENEGQFDTPLDIAVDGEGNVYVADGFNDRIQKFTGDGGFITEWGELGDGAGDFNFPRGVTVDGAGNVYVADADNDRIQKFDSNGVYLAQWGTEGSDNGQFNTPRGLAVDGAGNVYVADSDNDRIQKFNSNGGYLGQWGDSGSGIGQFNDPNDVAVDGAGNVYVADAGNHRIQKFDSDGGFITQWGGPGAGSGNGQFDDPNGVAVDGDGNVYVADTRNHRIQKFDSDGNYLGQWGSEGTGDGQFERSRGPAVDGDGNVYVVDTGNDRIQKFSQRTDFQLDDGQSQVFPALTPGDYTLSEIVPEEWELDDIDCDGGSPVVDGSSVSLTLGGGDEVTCTFRNGEEAAALFFSANKKGMIGDDVAFDDSDILMWDGTAWSLWFDGSAALLPPNNNSKHNVNAFWIPDESEPEVVMSFDKNSRKIPGLPGKVDGTDLVWWDGSAFSLWFDGSDVGLAQKAKEKIDGLHVLPREAAPDEFEDGCDFYLLISTHGPGQVQRAAAFGGGVLNFSGEDVLGFCATSLGEDTAGHWHMVLDGSTVGLPKNTLDSISQAEDGDVLYLTTTKAVDFGGGVAGGHSMVFSYHYGSGDFSGPHFSAPDNGLNRKVNGLQVQGSLEE